MAAPLNKGGPLPQPKGPPPSKSVTAAPRIKPASTREYGKGGTPLGQSLQNMNQGPFNVGYMGSSK